MARQPAGVPVELAQAPHGIVTTRLAQQTYAHPRPQLNRLARQGLLHPAAQGFFAVVPDEKVGRQAWKPGFDNLVARIVNHLFGNDRAVLMGVTAARIHHAIPRALATAVVATPRRRHTLKLTDRIGQIKFVERDLARLGTQTVILGGEPALVTTIEQTVLDLAREPDRGDARADAVAAVRVLWDRCDPQKLQDLAQAQNRPGAVELARRMAAAV